MPKFLPGQSGNPAGKKPGTLSLPGKLRAALGAEAGEILEAMVAKAKEGDIAAARLILDRVVAPLRATDELVHLQDANLNDLTHAPVALLGALGQGAITPAQLNEIASALASLVRVREATELEARLTALEGQRP
jgi:hypothetical protein